MAEGELKADGGGEAAPPQQQQQQQQQRPTPTTQPSDARLPGHVHEGDPNPLEQDRDQEDYGEAYPDGYTSSEDDEGLDDGGGSISKNGGDTPDAPTSTRRKILHKLRHPMPKLRQKLKKSSQLDDVKESAVHAKNKVGKLGNLVNRNHRHDEEHEQATDRKRTAVAQSHRFESFAPRREGCDVKWYIDGRDYFWAVSVALERAKESIYIEDWWLSPELFLRRPAYHHQDYRLDKLLKRKAQEGVKIYIIVYKEVAQALTCNSAHTKNVLRYMIPEGEPGRDNIIVMRHPDHNFLENAGDMTMYWAHHEKFIVIDYDLAFIGGLDLCFGRWDSRQHPLADVHPAGAVSEVFPGQDFNNNRILDFQTVDDWKSNELSKAEYGRMPWHDVAMGIRGPAVYDIAEHFVLRWNFCKRDKYVRDKRYPWITLQGRGGADEDLVAVKRPKFPVGGYVHHPITPIKGKDLADQGDLSAQIVRSSADWSSGILKEHSIQNAYCELIRNAQHYVYFENQFFITATGEEQSPIHNQIGRAIVDACVRAGKEGRKFRVIIIMPAIPGFAGDLRDDAAIPTRAVMDYQFKSINRGEHSIMERIRAQGVDPKNHIFVFNLRSYDRLHSTPALRAMEERSGVKYQEVQRAVAEEIMSSGIHGGPGDSSSSEGGFSDDEGAKEKTTNKMKEMKIAATPGDGVEGSKDPKGKSKRREAIEKRERFEAEAENVQHLNKTDGGSSGKTTGRNGVDSIAKDAMLGATKVSEEVWEGGDKEEEKEFFVQEELYIHAKVLIVDDKFAICGSSNINDRSQLGDHDSELAVVVEDPTPLEGKMDGKPYTASQFAGSLRRTLWREHLGLLPAQSLEPEGDPNALPPGDGHNDYQNGEHSSVATTFESGSKQDDRADAFNENTNKGNDGDAATSADTPGTKPDGKALYPSGVAPSVTPEQLRSGWDFVADPLSDELWETWCSQATTNTAVFRELFHADPDDCIKTWEDYEKFLPRQKDKSDPKSFFGGDKDEEKKDAETGKDADGSADNNKATSKEASVPSTSELAPKDPFATSTTDTKEEKKEKKEEDEQETGKTYKQGHLYASADISVEEVRRRLDTVRGHLVWHQLDFLRDEVMAEQGLQVNAATESLYT